MLIDISLVILTKQQAATTFEHELHSFVKYTTKRFNEMSQTAQRRHVRQHRTDFDSTTQPKQHQLFFSIRFCDNKQRTSLLVCNTIKHSHFFWMIRMFLIEKKHSLFGLILQSFHLFIYSFLGNNENKLYVWKCE